MAPIRPVAAPLLALALAAGTACSLDTPAPPAPELPRATYVAGLPAGWIVGGQLGTGFAVGVDTAVRHGGTRSATILGSPSPTAHASFAIGQPLRADAYVGRRVRLTGWVRTREVAKTGDGLGAVLWLRVDGCGVARANDSMDGRGVPGTTDWRQLAVVLDVPADAAGVIAGAIPSGSGQAWFDDLRLEGVGPDVPTTAGPPSTTTSDSATVAARRALYARYPAAPDDLDFEGAHAGALDAGAMAWPKQAAVPFDRADPTGALADLEPLRGMVGGARVVALGEGTHGTREFFQMKHRVLQFLVREMGFTAFAIEASWPEANAVDHYVRTGAGDPAVVLSNLYFWTWNAQEVAELMAWMRDYDRTVPATRQVRFLGFDMQFPGVAMDSVAAFGRGTFDAVEIGSDGTNRGLHPMPTDALPAGALEAYLGAVGAPRFLLDARRIAGAPAAAPLAGPLPMRSIGAAFTPGRDLQYFAQTLLPGDYALLLYFATTTPSTLLPFRFQ